ncbi:MAG TPA: DUF2087 domain-containing protein [Micromonosporaceae bacterium]|nr:DUF2087 domain-containing protein [Micromonosporaceae bacterium]
MKPDALCGLLAEPERLSAFAAVVLGATTPSEVASMASLPARDAVQALRRLEQGGLVSTIEGKLVAEVSVFKDAVREYAAPPDEPLDPDQARAAVLRAFIRDGRLLQFPVAHGKLRIVLEHIVACFEPGVRYPERAVDAILRAWHPDYAALRRYLIDEDLMARESGVYWRTGGPVDV